MADEARQEQGRGEEKDVKGEGAQEGERGEGEEGEGEEGKQEQVKQQQQQLKQQQQQQLKQQQQQQLKQQQQQQSSRQQTASKQNWFPASMDEAMRSCSFFQPLATQQEVQQALHAAYKTLTYGTRRQRKRVTNFVLHGLQCVSAPAQAAPSNTWLLHMTLLPLDKVVPSEAQSPAQPSSRPTSAPSSGVSSMPHTETASANASVLPDMAPIATTAAAATATLLSKESSPARTRPLDSFRLHHKRLSQCSSNQQDDNASHGSRPDSNYFGGDEDLCDQDYEQHNRTQHCSTLCEQQHNSNNCPLADNDEANNNDDDDDDDIELVHKVIVLTDAAAVVGDRRFPCVSHLITYYCLNNPEAPFALCIGHRADLAQLPHIRKPWFLVEPSEHDMARVLSSPSVPLGTFFVCLNSDSRPLRLCYKATATAAGECVIDLTPALQYRLGRKSHPRIPTFPT